ncbi:MAG: hypothetical protein PVF87_10375 [Acidimicrobiia bacterium]|jgi:hypothetical protein
MSRFDAARRGRIAVWTGAALAWGTAATLANNQPAQAEQPAVQPTTTTMVEAEATSLGAMPAMPSKGLVIIRYQPSPEETPEVRTVYVQQQAPTRSAPAAASPAPAPAPKAAAPAPKSGGS